MQNNPFLSHLIDMSRRFTQVQDATLETIIEQDNNNEIMRFINVRERDIDEFNKACHCLLSLSAAAYQKSPERFQNIPKDFFNPSKYQGIREYDKEEQK